jgi:hypothetical protein
MKHNPDNHAGPSLLLLALLHVLLFAASLAIAAVLRHGAGYVNPYEPAERVRSFFAQSPIATRTGGFFTFGSAIPLGLYTATIVSRLRFLGVRAAGAYISLFGGFLASAALVLCGLLTWVLSIPEVVASVPTVRALHFLSFLFGGMAFAVGIGLLAAGVSVIGLFTGLIPRALAIFGLLIAIAGELSSLSLLTYSVIVLLPITRFGGFIWLIAVAAKLPRARTTASNPGHLPDSQQI